jgi:glucose-1-phosphate cytidylyltransferase
LRTVDIQTDQRITTFQEKSEGDGVMINWGFFVHSRKVLGLIADDSSIWEHYLIGTLAKSNQLKAFEHIWFWHSIDTLSEKNLLEDLWRSGKAPRKVWQ